MRFLKRKERIDGQLVEVCRIDGKRVPARVYEREMKAAQKRHQKPPKVKKGSTRKGGAWPMRCQALTVHKKRIKQATEHAKKMGVPTSFHPSGDPIFTSPTHYREYCRAYGFVNLDDNASPRNL